MTLQQIARDKISMLSDSDLKILLVIADGMLKEKNFVQDRDVEKKMAAIDDLLKIRKRNPLPADFDFDIAREEALKEKYGCFN